MTTFRLFVIGDSISLGYGPSLERLGRGFFAYARKTGTETGLPERGLAADPNGGDSRQVLAYLRLRQETGGIPADVVLLNCGLHDVRRDRITRACQVPIEKYRANLQEMAGVVTALGLRLVWATTTPVLEQQHNSLDRTFERFNQDVNACNAAAVEIVSAAGGEIADLHSFTANLGLEAYTDGVHFAPEAAALQASFLVGCLKGCAPQEMPISR